MQTLKMEDDIIQIGEVIDYGIPFPDNTFFEANNVHYPSLLIGGLDV